MHTRFNCMFYGKIYKRKNPERSGPEKEAQIAKPQATVDSWLDDIGIGGYVFAQGFAGVAKQ
ncbi:MAG: hypothetical protein ACE5FF_07720 [Saprospiraceae bacterium]